MKIIVDLFLSLRGRLVFLASLATFPAVLFIFYLAEKERNSTFQMMEEEARHLAVLTAREHSYQIEGARTLLRWMGEKLLKDSPHSPITNDPGFLTALLVGHPQLANIGVATNEGEVITSAYPMPAFPNMIDNPAVKRAINSREVETGNYLISPIVGRPVLNLAFAVRNPDGTIFRIVFDAIDLQWLTTLAKQVDLPPDYILLIVDRDGRILTHSGVQGESTLKIGSMVNGLSNLSENGGGKIIKLGESERNHFLFSRPMAGVQGVSVVSGLPFDRINEKVNRTFFRILGGLLLLTLLTLFSVLVSAELSVLRSLRLLSTAARKFGEGILSVRASIPDTYGELKDLADEFNKMADSLEKRHQELTEAHEKLLALSRHLQIARESEARRISRELHDEIGQVLTSLKMDLMDLRRKCLPQGPLAPEWRGPEESKLDEIFSGLSKNIDGSIEFVRRLSAELRPNILDKLGLTAAIEWQARELEKRAKITVSTKISDISEPANWLVSIALFRIAQEAFTNISRHAQAKTVSVELSSEPDGLVLIIGDDGIGLSDKDIHRTESLGIVGMQERTRLVKGNFSLIAESGKGTVLTIRIPNQSVEEVPHENFTG